MNVQDQNDHTCDRFYFKLERQKFRQLANFRLRYQVYDSK